ncbi:hypothetical protein LAZ67_2003569 [Cordylochernes scorpioides]|uniref:Uncharacterized protein n=1 Tax=Cordylochernes scorpioides TaxID=51811 RepID=A0ABY6K337_9ARAC|nr:hypothetical protein LAZ67_2003569 [Cordylochernes scorpioides]
MESVKDEKRVGRPILHRNPEKVSQIPNLIKENPRIGLRDIEEETGISKSLVGSIIKEDLQLKKTPSKFVHKILTIKQNENRVEIAKKMIEMVEENPNWKYKVITGDDTRVYVYDPETKRQSMEWKGKDEPRTKKSRLCNYERIPYKRLRRKKGKMAAGVNKLEIFSGEKGSIRPESWLKLYELETIKLDESERINNLIHYQDALELLLKCPAFQDYRLNN